MALEASECCLEVLGGVVVKPVLEGGCTSNSALASAAASARKMNVREKAYQATKLITERTLSKKLKTIVLKNFKWL